MVYGCEEMVHHDVVILRRQRITQLRLACQAGVLVGLGVALVCGLSFARNPMPRAAHARRSELLQTQLRLRSAALVVKDLAGDFDMAGYKDEPFDFCGKSHMTTRQVKVCAEYFLGSLRDTLGDNERAKSLAGFPTLAAYDKCMVAPTHYMLKACIREVTRAMTPDEIVHQTRTGSTGHDADLDKIAMHAIKTAEPEASISGLNGGVNGKLAEMSSQKYLKKVDMVGDASKVTKEEAPDATGWKPEPGCTSLGLGGCDSPSDGGLKHNLKEWALQSEQVVKPPPEP